MALQQQRALTPAVSHVQQSPRSPQASWDPLFTPRPRRERVRDIIAAIALSLLVHAAALWTHPQRIHVPSDEFAEVNRSLSVQLAPRPSPPQPAPSPPAVQAQRPAPAPARRPKAAPRPQPKAPVLALKERAPTPSPVPPPDKVPPPAPPAPATTPPVAGDLSSYIEARRRARGDTLAAAPAPSTPSTPSRESENQRANRIAAANLGLDRTPTFGPDMRGGGIFAIQHLSHDYAEFLFFGWNKDIRRNTTQLIEVRRGDNADIRVAVVMKMIAIIREHEQGDFVWESHRLGRNVMLSARPRDNAGLQDFLMQEFFDELRRVR